MIHSWFIINYTGLHIKKWHNKFIKSQNDLSAKSFYDSVYKMSANLKRILVFLYYLCIDQNVIKLFVFLGVYLFLNAGNFIKIIILYNMFKY